MPTLLPRWFTGMASIISIPILRPSLYRHEVGNHIKFTRLHTAQPSKRPISSSFRNSRHLIAQTPLLRTTKAYGQFLGRDFNPLAKLLLLRTSVPYCFTGLQTPSRFNFSYQIFAAKLTSFRNSKCSPFCPITYNPLRIAYVATLSGMTMPATAPEIRLSL